MPARPSASRADRTATILKDGKPYRGVGINYFDCFYRTLKNPVDTFVRIRLSDTGRPWHPLRPFLRYWILAGPPPSVSRRPRKYLSLLDAVVRTAEKHGIGLIPSLFWYFPCVPDLVGEPCDSWGNPESKTHAFMRDYVHAIVSRYAEFPAIWAWEFGNEYDSYTDMPNAATYLPEHHIPKVDVRQGTPEKRTPRDFPKTAYNLVAYREFAKAVRRYDPYRLIENGQSITNKRAWHAFKEGKFGVDTPEQFEYHAQPDFARPHGHNQRSLLSGPA